LEDSLALTEDAIRFQRTHGPSIGPYADRIAMDAENLIHDTRAFISEKNRHGHIQKVIVELTRAAEQEAQRASQTGKDVARSAAVLGRKLKYVPLLLIEPFFFFFFFFSSSSAETSSRVES
jgi:hypothetical protein